MNPVTSGTPHRENGFTIVELCISIALLGVVMLVLTGVLFTGAKVNSETRQRLGSAYDVQRATVAFSQDVYGAELVALGGTPLCGSATPLVTFQQDSFVPGSPPTPRVTVVSYFMSGSTLRRVECAGPNASTLSQTSQSDVARKISGTPIVECVDGAGAVISGCASLPVSVRLRGLSIDGRAQILNGTRRNLWCMSNDPTPVPTTTCSLNP